MSDKTELTREEVETFLAARGGPVHPLLGQRGIPKVNVHGCCLGCGSWTAPGHPDAHDHEDDCPSEAAYAAWLDEEEAARIGAYTLARQLLATMDELAEARATLAAILAGFVEQGHPGQPCVRHGWVSVEQVEKWRAALATTEPPDAD